MILLLTAQPTRPVWLNFQAFQNDGYLSGNFPIVTGSSRLKFFLNFWGFPWHQYLWREVSSYHKYTEPLFHAFMYSLVSLLSGIYPLPAMHLCHGKGK